MSNQIGNDGMTYPPMSEEKKAELVEVMKRVKRQPTLQARLREYAHKSYFRLRQTATPQ